ncbi:ribose-5-phosphate isomerase [Chitinophaga skermanii]|uniref:Ribose 5-phosphate isomerase A n=1 Tax=Chitinophaga skermanii TaxID=331697 RepID=A0A327Q0E9_9BACT|nr:ribose 5-phosphate isomerase A [Chitinophaga skermanii]RAI97858.1 ribose-5-phosphate isomerase [Chitinophaga skermanii]
MEDLKQKAAAAAYQLVQPGMLVGFGAGSTIAHLIEKIKLDENLARSITAVTSSFNTQQLLQAHQIKTQAISVTTYLDIYFDGCDLFDQSLNALKSGGGIHTREKLLAAMARDFILIGDGSKFVPQLLVNVPVVIEVLQEAIFFVQQQILQLWPNAKAILRLSNKKDGAVITEHGNALIDIYFESMPAVGMINTSLKAIPGVLETSLFYQMATQAIIADKKSVQHIYRER